MLVSHVVYTSDALLGALFMYSRHSLLAQLQEKKNLPKIPLLLLECYRSSSIVQSLRSRG